MPTDREIRQAVTYTHIILAGLDDSLAPPPTSPGDLYAAQKIARALRPASAVSAEPEVVTLAVESCRIETLQRLEAKHGFELSPRDDRQFFRSGVPGEGAVALSAEARATLSEAGRDVMARLGYSADGSVTSQ